MMDVVGHPSGGAAPPPTWSLTHPSWSSLLLTVTVLLVVAGMTPCASGSGHFTDQWAVRVDGSEEDARRLAQRHDFVYVDQVGIVTSSCLSVKVKVNVEDT